MFPFRISYWLLYYSVAVVLKGLVQSQDAALPLDLPGVNKIRDPKVPISKVAGEVVKPLGTDARDGQLKDFAGDGGFINGNPGKGFDPSLPKDAGISESNKQVNIENLEQAKTREEPSSPLYQYGKEPIDLAANPLDERLQENEETNLEENVGGGMDNAETQDFLDENEIRTETGESADQVQEETSEKGNEENVEENEQSDVIEDSQTNNQGDDGRSPFSEQSAPNFPVGSDISKETFKAPKFPPVLLKGYGNENKAFLQGHTEDLKASQFLPRPEKKNSIETDSSLQNTNTALENSGTDNKAPQFSKDSESLDRTETDNVLQKDIKADLKNPDSTEADFDLDDVSNDSQNPGDIALNPFQDHLKAASVKENSLKAPQFPPLSETPDDAESVLSQDSGNTASLQENALETPRFPPLSKSSDNTAPDLLPGTVNAPVLEEKVFKAPQFPTQPAKPNNMEAENSLENPYKALQFPPLLGDESKDVIKTALNAGIKDINSFEPPNSLFDVINNPRPNVFPTLNDDSNVKNDFRENNAEYGLNAPKFPDEPARELSEKEGEAATENEDFLQQPVEGAPQFPTYVEETEKDESQGTNIIGQIGVPNLKDLHSVSVGADQNKQAETVDESKAAEIGEEEIIEDEQNEMRDSNASMETENDDAGLMEEDEAHDNKNGAAPSLYGATETRNSNEHDDETENEKEHGDTTDNVEAEKFEDYYDYDENNTEPDETREYESDEDDETETDEEAGNFERHYDFDENNDDEVESDDELDSSRAVDNRQQSGTSFDPLLSSTTAFPDTDDSADSYDDTQDKNDLYEVDDEDDVGGDDEGDVFVNEVDYGNRVEVNQGDVLQGEQVVDSDLVNKNKQPTAPSSMVLVYTWMIIAVLLMVVGLSTYQTRCKGFRLSRGRNHQSEDRKRLLDNEFV